jgi:hypothetical protein
MHPRTVALIAALSLASGWLASTVVSQDPQSTVPADAPRGPRPLGRQDAVAPYTQQLRLKLQEHPRSPSPGRNPFVFGQRRPATAPAASRATELASPPAEPIEAPIAPVLRFDLSGIAMNRQDDVEVFTAIVNDNGNMVFVKAGDRLSNGYTVVRVEEATVVIADIAGVELILRLK